MADRFPSLDDFDAGEHTPSYGSDVPPTDNVQAKPNRKATP